MGETKYNKAELWKSFLESEHLDVLPWAKENDVGMNIGGERITTPFERIVMGWGEKKKGIIEKSIAKYNEKYQDKLSSDWEKVAKNCTAGEMKILNDFALAIHGGRVPKGTKALERVFKMFRLALGKSTNNNQNTNNNLNIPVSEDDVQQIADVVKRSNEHYNRPGMEAADTEAHED